MLGVVRGNGQADLRVRLKAAGGREHQEGWRLEGVLWREQDAPMEDASLQKSAHIGTLNVGDLHWHMQFL